MGTAFRGYDRIVRNGLAHGAVEFANHEFQYTSKNAVATYSPREALKLFDTLLDSCNALVFAFRLFLAESERPLPRQHIYEALRLVTKTPWWEVQSCMVSRALPNRSQLVVFADATTTDRDKLSLALLSTGTEAERLAPGVERYFVSATCPSLAPAFVALNGAELEQLRRGDNPHSDISSAVESGMLPVGGFSWRPGLLHRAETYMEIARSQFRVLAAKARATEHRRGRFEVRDVQAHRNEWGIVIQARVTLGNGHHEASKGSIKPRLGALEFAVQTAARKRAGKWWGILPIAFLLVSVYRRDYRARHLRSFGLGPDLVCTVRRQRMERMKAPDITGAEIEQVGTYRVAWNRSWLTEQAML